MSQLKTQKNSNNVSDFLDSVENEQQRADCQAIAKIMQTITGEKPAMWGDSIVGFGSYHYKYKSGREGDWFLTGFSPRKQQISIYLFYGLEDFTTELEHLGKYKTAKSCLYIKQLSDIDQTVLKDLIRKSVKKIKAANE